MPKTKILVVDDDDVYLMLVQEHLEEHGFEVLVATEGRQAIALACEQSPDLVLCDVIMSEFDGFRVLAALKASAATADIPVILMTGNPRGEDERRAAEAGADAYLAKVGRFDFIISRIEERLAGATALRRMSSALPPPTGAPRQKA